MAPHLNQKYDQEVEVCDPSELLKQILGYEVPQGILRDRAAAQIWSQIRKGHSRAMNQHLKHGSII